MYTDEEKRIFRYHNGEEDTAGDPLLLNAAIFDAADKHQCDINGAIADIQVGQMPNAADKDQQIAVKQIALLAKVVNEAFGCKPIHLKAGQPHGLTADESMELLRQFFEWLETTQKKT